MIEVILKIPYQGYQAGDRAILDATTAQMMVESGGAIYAPIVLKPDDVHQEWISE